MPELDIAPAPAPVDSPVVVSATDAAVESRDFSAYREAKAAERAGKPLEPVAAKTEETPAPAPVVQPERQLSKRQQQINDYERRIAAQDAELAALRAGSAPKPTEPPPPPKSAADAPAKFDSWEKYSESHPEATYDDYVDARADFRIKQAQAESQREQQAHARAEAHVQTQQAFQERIAKHAEANPDFLESVDKRLLDLRPTADLKEGERVSALNVLADHILKSDVAPALLQHFTANPDDVSQLARLPPPDFFLRMGKLEAALEKAASPAAEPKPLSRMTPPATTLGNRSGSPVDQADAALKNGNFEQYKQARTRERLATLKR